MKSFNYIFLLVAALAVSVTALQVTVPTAIRPPAHATCSCRMPESVKDGYKSENTPVFKATAIETRGYDAHYTYTAMKVAVVFRGCVPTTKEGYIIVRSPKTAASCGVVYTQKVTYAVTAAHSRSSTPPPGVPAGVPWYTATSCTYNKPWGACPHKDKVFLYYSDPTCK